MTQKITFVFLLVYGSMLYAQTPIEKMGNQKTYVQKIDSLFINLDKHSMETNILYDRVISFAKLQGFNERGDTTNAKHFKQAWSELYRAGYAPDFKDLTTRTAFVEKTRQQNAVETRLLNMTNII